MYPSKECIWGNKLTGVECSVVRRNAIESDLEKMGVSTLILVYTPTQSLRENFGSASTGIFRR